MRLVERFAAAGGRIWPGIVEQAVRGAEWAQRTGQTDALVHGRVHLAAIDGETGD